MTNQEAIEILGGIRACYNLFDEDDEIKYAALSKAIIVLKAAQKHGKWNKIKENSWACSECKKENCYAFHYNDDLTGLILQDFFCPYCGARMDGEENEAN